MNKNEPKIKTRQNTGTSVVLKWKGQSGKWHQVQGKINFEWINQRVAEIRASK